MPEIKNGSVTSMRVGKVIQPSDLPASIEAGSAGQDANIPKAAGAKKSPRPAKASSTPRT